MQLYDYGRAMAVTQYQEMIQRQRSQYLLERNLLQVMALLHAKHQPLFKVPSMITVSALSRTAPLSSVATVHQYSAFRFVHVRGFSRLAVPLAWSLINLTMSGYFATFAMRSSWCFFAAESSLVWASLLDFLSAL